VALGHDGHGADELACGALMRWRPRCARIPRA
jgi:hypothetical protein